MFTATASACAVGMQRLLQSFREHMHKPPPPVKFPISPFHFSTVFLNSPTSENSCVPMAVNWNVYRDHLNNFLNSNRKPPVSTIPPPQNSIIPPTQDAVEDKKSCKVKLLCSFGAKVMSHDCDGNLHYVGGETRIIAVRRDTSFSQFCCKMKEAYGGPIRISYQLPNQSIDIHISVFTLDDFEQMMEEFDCLSNSSGCGFPKVRVYVFPQLSLEGLSAKFDNATYNDGGPSYINTTNTRGERFMNKALEHQNFRAHSNVGKKNTGARIGRHRRYQDDLEALRFQLRSIFNC